MLLGSWDRPLRVPLAWGGGCQALMLGLTELVSRLESLAETGKVGGGSQSPGGAAAS